MTKNATSTDATILAAFMLLTQPFYAEAAPVLLSPKEFFNETPLVGAPAFLGVGQLAPHVGKALTTISFVNSGVAQTSACFTMISRDGKYRATAPIKSDQLKVKGIYTFYFNSAYPRAFDGASDRDMAVEIKFAADCEVPDSSNIRAISWFGEVRPSGSIRLSFQSLGHDSYYVPGEANAKPLNCEKITSGINIAFDAVCALPMIQSDETRGEVRIFDIDGQLTETIRVVIEGK